MKREKNIDKCVTRHGAAVRAGERDGEWLGTGDGGRREGSEGGWRGRNEGCCVYVCLSEFVWIFVENLCLYDKFIFV